MGGARDGHTWGWEMKKSLLKSFLPHQLSHSTQLRLHLHQAKGQVMKKTALRFPASYLDKAVRSPWEEGNCRTWWCLFRSRCYNLPFTEVLHFPKKNNNNNKDETPALNCMSSSVK